jgi:putative ABC transport system permease protein
MNEPVENKKSLFENLLEAITFFVLNSMKSMMLALTSLWSRRLRSLLTLTGVIIGVATVITVVSVIEGMNQYVVGTLSNFGYDTFIISKFGLITSRDEFFEARRRKRITMDQMVSLRENCTLCKAVGGTIARPGKIKRGREYIEDVEIVGATSNILEIGEYRLDEGRMFTSTDQLHKRSVCVIGNEVRDVLFPNQDPINKEIKVGQQQLTVIGINEKRGSFLGENLDNFILIPITLHQKMYGSNKSIDIYVKTMGREILETTKDQAGFLMRAIRDVKKDEKDDFGFVTTNALMDMYRDFTGMAYFVMIGVASISLLVGGIVIMNIMLVTVTERIKEIGIRKAVGARKSDIVGQFLAESVTIAIVGGIIGISLGAGIAKIISQFSPLPSSVALWAVLAGVSVSGTVGICFGLFPAIKASRMDPIIALRQE